MWLPFALSPSKGPPEADGSTSFQVTAPKHVILNPSAPLRINSVKDLKSRGASSPDVSPLLLAQHDILWGLSNNYSYFPIPGPAQPGITLLTTNGSYLSSLDN